jgi:16S rRNA (cytosine967-C5)-methyltransferase
MTPAARLAAAMEILADHERRRRPISEALREWGQQNRFSGSKDRANIAGLVHDVLRVKAMSGWIMQATTPRALVIGMLHVYRRLDLPALETLFSGERFAPSPLTQRERQALEHADPEKAPPAIQANCPDWVWPLFESALGEGALNTVQALTARAPLDIRVNTQKISREALQISLMHWSPMLTPRSPFGLRFPHFEDGRGPALQSEPDFLKGHFEIQDEGSQIAALLSQVRPGETVIDLCAGAGGKTLALAVLMQNYGRLIASDADSRRLAPLHERVRRAGLEEPFVQIRTPRPGQDVLEDMAGKADCVLVDAPCTGTGTWRRHPDAKWRLRPGSLSTRIREQALVLDQAARLVRPGGRIIYITCSLLSAENDDAIEACLSRHSHLERTTLTYSLLPDLPQRPTRHGILLTPDRTGTDGFYISNMVRKF